MNRLISSSLKVALTAWLAILVFASAAGQEMTGSLKGLVTDQLGGLVVEATIVVKDAKGGERTTTTSSTGGYEFRALPPGKYELKVLAPGFNVLEQKEILVTSGKTTNLDLELVIGTMEQTVTVDSKGLSTDSDKNADATVLRGRELETLPDDPDALASALKAMAGPTQDENGPQVKVDGFSNGQIPPKESIREIRINNNPYSAENEYPGWGGIEIYTQPGSDKWHGGASFSFNDESLNSRNPFAFRRAPYQQRNFGFNLTGPLKKKRASFALYFNRYGSESNAVINATTLDANTLKPVLFNETLVTSNFSKSFNLRGDVKLSKKHTMVSNYEYYRNSQDPQGIGGFSLPSRGYKSGGTYQNLQMTETAVINEKTINETRLQLSHNLNRQIAQTVLPALNVQDSFFGGGSQVGSSSNTQDRGELQNFTSWQVGRHFLKVGGRLRYVRIKSISPANFGGTYTFAGGVGPALDGNEQPIPNGGTVAISSLEQYRRTLLFQRMGLSAAQIRNLGGGATQFSIAGGNPAAAVKQNDISLYIQDEWKVREHLTISPGLRYENQQNINSDWNFAPRVGFAWSPMIGGKKKSTPATSQPAPITNSKDSAQVKPAALAKPAPAPSQPKTVVRGGFGIFYNRFNEDLILQTLRFNGLNQEQFVVTDPAILDLFPTIPPINLLTAFAQPQTRRFLNSNVAPSMSMRSSIGIEHQISKTMSVQATYSFGFARRLLRTENINAPLAGTFNPLDPTSGTRPLGEAAGNILEYESNGRSRFNNISVSANGRISKIGFWSNYSLNWSHGVDSGTSGSPFNPYDFNNEWGSTAYDIRHRFFSGAYYQTKSGFSLNTFVVANSGLPFNITTGHDTNGDTFFTERPGYATDLNKPGVILTPFGALDPNPTPDEKIIPRNLGHGPGLFTISVGASKAFKFGPAIPPKTGPAPANAVTTTKPSTTENPKPPAKLPVQRPYQFVFAVFINNFLNHNNRGPLIGNMASPYFLQSTGSSGSFFSFGPGGGAPGGNRQITFRARLSF